MAHATPRRLAYPALDFLHERASKVRLGLVLHRQFDMALSLVHGLAGHFGAVMGEAYRREGVFVLDQFVE